MTVTQKNACPETEPTHSECSSHLLAIGDTMDVLRGKWKVSILTALSFHTYRFKELARIIGVSPRMLSKELKELEQHELILRTVYPTTPVTVEYTMTEYGKSLHKVIGAMHDWGLAHRKRIMGKKK